MAEQSPKAPKPLEDAPSAAPPRAAPLRRAGVAVLLGLGLIALVGGLIEVLAGPETIHDLLSFKTIGLNYGVLRQYVDQHYWLAAAMFVGSYGLLGLFLLPGSTIFVVGSGLLFGARIGIPLASIGSALAASLAFGTARFAFGGAVERLKLPAVETLKAGFQRHALSYMMFLRLTPGLPFAVLNAAPALLGVRFSTFLTGTVVGLLPSRIALSTAGAGLAKAIDVQNASYYQCIADKGAAAQVCPYNIHIATLLTPETIAAFFALALLALTPALLDFGQRLGGRGRGTKAG